jgi:hypothetical protein
MVEFVERSWKNGSRAVPNTPLVIFYFFQGRFRFRPYNMNITSGRGETSCGHEFN